MKSETPRGTSRIRRHRDCLLFCALLNGPLALAALSQEAKPVSAPTASSDESLQIKASTVAKPEKNDATGSRPMANPPVSIADVLKMIDAGVSPDIIKALVENSTAAYDPNAADLITLKTNGVPDDVTASLMKRVAEIKAINQKKQADQAAAQRNAGPAPMDPESYDFWWYNHGYPRVMSSTYRQLDPYPGGPVYSYGRSLRPPVYYPPGRDPRFSPQGSGKRSRNWSR
ncbi:MAG: hypothetical protein H7X97_09450 [Opitutaceae bacterium]|nr:hypothetical protein [Verrucomicrobiales bacterium]